MAYKYYSKEQNDFIIHLYFKTGNSLSLAQKMYGEKYGELIPQNTIRRKWRKEELEPNSHGGHRHGNSDEQLKELHRKYDGDLKKIAEEGEYTSIDHLKRRLNKLGLELKF